MVTNLGDFIKGIFPHAFTGEKLPDHIKEVYPDFDVYVSVIKARSPSHEFFEYILDMGRYDIYKVFSGDTLKENLCFIFPERWMSVHQQHYFMSVLTKHKSKKEIKSVLIATSSALLVSEFFKEQIRILTFPDDKLEF